MSHIFIHSSVGGHLGCFCVLALVNSAAVNIGVYVSFRMEVFSGYLPRSQIAGSYDISVFEGVSEVAQLCLTLCDPMDCSLPGSSLHGIPQARTLEWVAISFSRGSSRPRDRTRVSRIAGRCFNH